MKKYHRITLLALSLVMLGGLSGCCKNEDFSLKKANIFKLVKL